MASAGMAFPAPHSAPGKASILPRGHTLVSCLQILDFSSSAHLPIRAPAASVSRCVAVRATLKPRRWPEYEDAVQSMDLARALELLEALNTFESDTDFAVQEQGDGAAAVSMHADLLGIDAFKKDVMEGQEEFLKILDVCLSASDLSLVARAYNWLNVRGVLPNFGRYKARASEGVRVVTPAVLLASTGLEASKLSPKKWGLSGSSAVFLTASLALLSLSIDNNLDVRPILAVLLGLGLLDAIYLGGTGYGQVLSLWSPYRRRVLVHEAGHVVAAYLLGCPVRGVILDAMQAVRMGIQGQAGTQFWDATLEEELKQDRLTSRSIDRYCIVLFAGIAAEAMVYGEAEGGESDENLYKGVVSLLRPPWSPAKMSNQARWAVIQAMRILKEQRKAHNAVVEALEKGSNLGAVIKELEANVV